MINMFMKSSNEAEKEQPKAVKPEGLPSKFWDEESSSVKLDELLEDYNSLIARDENLVETSNRLMPQSYEEYEVEIKSPLLDRDDEVFKRMYDCGFTNAQAQLVYDLANERVLPLLDELTVSFEAQKQLEKLYQEFGGQEKFDIISRQISTWAKANLKPEIYDALGSTAEGVKVLYSMMSSQEPVLSKELKAEDVLSENKLRKMMEDPRYWRDHDKAYIEQISKGFEALYPGK